MKPWLLAPDHWRYRRTPRVMLPTPDVKAQPRSRRRYAQGSTRSKTIELGTLSEIEEDIYHNKEAASQSGVGSQDDSAVNVRWPKNGAVKSIARHFSERLKSEQGKFPRSYWSLSKIYFIGRFELQLVPLRIQLLFYVPVHCHSYSTFLYKESIPMKNATDINLHVLFFTSFATHANTCTTCPLPLTYDLLEDHYEQFERPISNGSNGNSSGTNGNLQSKCEFKPDQTDFRQQLMDCTNRRRVQYMPERSCSRTSFTQWDKAHYVDEKCRLPHSTMSEFYASAAASSLARTQAAIPIQSTPSSSTGTILVPNSRVMSMADPRAPKLHVSNCPMSIWYSPQPTFPPPPPMYIPIGHPVMPLPPKILIKRKKSSACSEICCGGVAQMLWTLICVVLLGIVGVLITALFYV
ncbi:hypothetical protein V3C99_008542 [Haemonchus contortus]